MLERELDGAPRQNSARERLEPRVMPHMVSLTCWETQRFAPHEVAQSDLAEMLLRDDVVAVNAPVAGCAAEHRADGAHPFEPEGRFDLSGAQPASGAA